MSEFEIRRFWTETGVAQTEDGWTVTLDGRHLRTPGKAPLILPTRAYAEECAAEWESQVDVVRPDSMPLTRAANSAIDKVASQFDAVAGLITAYGETDLLCYRAEGPDSLVQRQAAAWDPLLDWAAEALGARLEPTTGIMHRPQDPEALARLAEAARGFGPFELTAFHDLVALSGSLIIGFAAARRTVSPETLWAASRIDEDWQAEQWGIDEEAAEQAALRKQAFVQAAHIFAILECD